MKQWHKMDTFRKIFIFLISTVILIFILYLLHKAPQYKDIESLKAEIKAASESKDVKMQIKLQNELIYRLLYSDIVKAEKLAEKTRELIDNYADALEFTEGLADIYNNLGLIDFIRGKYEDAIKNFQNALKESENKPYIEGMLDAFNGIAHCKRMLGKHDEALENYLISMSIAEQHGKVKQLAYCYYGIAALYYYEGMDVSNQCPSEFLKECLNFLNKCLKLRKESGNKNEIAATYYAIGQIKLMSRNTEEAYEYFKECLSLSIEIDDEYNLANSFEGIADCLLEERGSNDLAKEIYDKLIQWLYDKSYNIFKEKFNDIFQLAELKIRMAKFEKERNNPDIEEEFLNDAKNKAEEIDNFKVQKKAVNALMIIDDNKYKKDHDKLVEISSENKMIRIRTEVLTEIIQEKRIDNLIKVIVFGGLILLIVVILVINGINRRNIKTLKRLDEIGRLITSSFSPMEIYERVAQQTKSLMDAPVFWLYQYDEKKESLVFYGGEEEDLENSSHAVKLTEIKRPAVKCFLHEDIIVFGDYQREYLKKYKEPAPSQIKGETYNSHIFLCLVIEGKDNKKKKIGLITVQSSKYYAYNDYHVNILKNIGGYAAIALDNANAYNQLDKQKKETEKEKEIAKKQRKIAEEQRKKTEEQRIILETALKKSKKFETQLKECEKKLIEYEKKR